MASAAHDVSMADKPTFPYLIVILLLFLKSVNPYRDGLGIFFLSFAQISFPASDFQPEGVFSGYTADFDGPGCVSVAGSLPQCPPKSAI